MARGSGANSLGRPTRTTCELQHRPTCGGRSQSCPRLLDNGVPAASCDGFCDDDALLWERGFLSEAGFSADAVAPGYIVQASGEVQGIVVIELEPRASRTQSNAGVTYISYLASAPWNRRDERLRGYRFHGTGRLLVLLAITASVDLGCQGLVGLHSFPVAAPFYVRLGFQNLGVDPAQRGMPYFELAADSAQKLLDEARRQKC